jgi:hypothetical protein
LSKGSKWYDIPPRPFHITIEVHPSLCAHHLIDTSAKPPIMARRLTAALEDFFARRLASHG